MKKILIAGICLMGLYFSSYAQTYTLSQSSSAYSSISGTTLASGSSWNGKGYKIPIGFSFSFMGKSFDTLTIAPNGLILFGDDNKRAIAAFKGIMPVTDSKNNTSSISYASSGNILKIEYKNVGFGLYHPDNFNFQVWLSKSGNTIEFHTGATTLSVPWDSLTGGVPDSLIMPVVGIINPSMDKSNNGYLLAGNPLQPTAETLIGDLKYLIRVPDANTVYKLTPQ